MSGSFGGESVRAEPFDSARDSVAGDAQDSLRREAAESKHEQPSGLRAEHDALASRLAARRSIDLVRRGAYTAFAGLISVGLSIKLAVDRWFSVRPTRFKGPPVFFFAALAVALVLVVLAAVAFARARRLMRGEDAEFARLRALREQLELDP